MPTRGLRDARCEFTPERIESASCQEGDRTAHTRLRACKCHRSRVPRRRRLDRGSQSRQRFPEVLRHSTRRKPEKPGFASSTNNKTRFCVIRRVERLSRPVKPTYRRADAYSRILTPDPMQLPFALGDLVFVARTVDPSPDPLSLGTFGRLWPLFVCVPFVLFAELLQHVAVIQVVDACSFASAKLLGSSARSRLLGFHPRSLGFHPRSLGFHPRSLGFFGFPRLSLSILCFLCATRLLHELRVVRVDALRVGAPPGLLLGALSLLLLTLRARGSVVHRTR
jgi:hypothetical protein